jgi:hypothetical protein
MHPDRARICLGCERPLAPWRWKADGRSCECLTPPAIGLIDPSVWPRLACDLRGEQARTAKAVAGPYAPVGALVWCQYWGDYYRVLDAHGDGTVSVATLLPGPEGALDRVRRHRTPLSRGRDVWANRAAMRA